MIGERTLNLAVAAGGYAPAPVSFVWYFSATAVRNMGKRPQGSDSAADAGPAGRPGPDTIYRFTLVAMDNGVSHRPGTNEPAANMQVIAAIATRAIIFLTKFWKGLTPTWRSVIPTLVYTSHFNSQYTNTMSESPVIGAVYDLQWTYFDDATRTRSQKDRGRKCLALCKIEIGDTQVSESGDSSRLRNSSRVNN
ncbi:hypothetical protein DFH09DRAFT_1096037 [Mycena vulgaris]|nr:hypothetical protein DFH09DRAFT_1096037 [Mycena vulgaris]